MSGKSSILSQSRHEEKPQPTPLDTDNPLPSTRPVIHDDGITELYAPKDGTTIVADLCFVHGLMGHPRKTWEYGKDVTPSSQQLEDSNSKSGLFRVFSLANTSKTSFIDNNAKPNHAQDTFDRPSSTTTYWPYDFVTCDFPDVRVLTYGYDSHPTHYYRRPTNQMTTSQHSRKLLEQLTNNRISCRGRPIIFVAHSLGGILVKEALIESLKFEDDNVAHDLGMSCFAIIFFGTPHAGAGIAEVGKRLAQAAEYLTFRMNVDVRILDDLKRNSSYLELVNRDFIQISRKRSYELYCFQEGLPLSIFEGKGKKIVPDESSSFNNRAGERSCFIPADHRDICRFKSPDTSPYKDFRGVLADYLSKMKDQSNRKASEQLRQNREALIRLLDFNDRLVRQEQIRQLRTTETSFDWIWSSQFVDWLKDTTSPLFWISGKPASGKSTLMSYISRSQKPLSILKGVSGKDWKRIYFFFDFRAGDGERNNFNGLVRSLMVQLLREIPDLYPHLAELYQIDLVNLHGKADRDIATILPPSLIRDALEGCLQKLPKPLLMLLDGLDEYEGDQLDLVALIKQTCSKATKICVSCRPEPQLASAFETVPSFAMQDLNRPGIQVSTLSKLKIQFEGSTFLDDNAMLNLAEEITARSEGVFLWATFAINEIIQGISRGESTKSRALIHRLEQIPQELKDIYARIFKSKPDSTRKWAGFALLLICAAKDKILALPVLQEALTWIPEIISELHVHESDVFQDPCPQDVAAFEKRLTNATGGAIEFYKDDREGHLYIRKASCPTARLVHKTVETYLNSVGWFQTLGHDISAFYGHEVWIRICVRQWTAQYSLISRAKEVCNKYWHTFQARDLVDVVVVHDYDYGCFPIDKELCMHCDNVYHTDNPPDGKFHPLLRYNLLYLPLHAELFEHVSSSASYSILEPALTSHYATWHRCYLRTLPMQLFYRYVRQCFCDYEPFVIGNGHELLLSNPILYRTLQIAASHKLNLFLDEFLAEGGQSYSQLHSNPFGATLWARLPWLNSWPIFNSKPSLSLEHLEILRKHCMWYAERSTWKRVDREDALKTTYAQIKRILALAPRVEDDELIFLITKAVPRLVKTILSHSHFTYRKLQVHDSQFFKFRRDTPTGYITCTPLALLTSRRPSDIRPSDASDITEILDTLLNHGADLNEICGPLGTILHYAIDSVVERSDSFGLFVSLITTGADINKEGPNGRPLEMAWERCHNSMEVVIGTHRHDITEINEVFRRFERIIRILVQEGAKNERRDPDGTVPTSEQMRGFRGPNLYDKRGGRLLLSRILNYHQHSIDLELYEKFEACLMSEPLYEEMNARWESQAGHHDEQPDEQQRDEQQHDEQQHVKVSYDD